MIVKKTQHLFTEITKTENCYPAVLILLKTKQSSMTIVIVTHTLTLVVIATCGLLALN